MKSNAIVYARRGQTVGIGAGQMSRVDSVKLGAMKAVLPLAGTVVASDAFFPFRRWRRRSRQARRHRVHSAGRIGPRRRRHRRRRPPRESPWSSPACATSATEDRYHPSPRAHAPIACPRKQAHEAMWGRLATCGRLAIGLPAASTPFAACRYAGQVASCGRLAIGLPAAQRKSQPEGLPPSSVVVLRPRVSQRYVSQAAHSFRPQDTFAPGTSSARPNHVLCRRPGARHITRITR